MTETHGGAGHNISAYDECAIRKDELVEAASNFLKADHKITEDNEGAVSDFIVQGRAGLKQIEDARVAERKPHLDANTAIQAKYAAISDPLTRAVSTIKDKLGKFLKVKQEKVDEAKRREQEEAERLRRDAAEKTAAVQSHDFAGQVEAEEAAKAAETAEKVAAKAPVNAQAKGSLGRGVHARTRYAGEITDLDKCLHHYRCHPKIREALQSLVNSDVNAKTKIHDIPGVTVKPVYSAA